MHIIDRVRGWFNVMPRAEARVWRTPSTLAQYGTLTAEWLEGRISSQPGYQPGFGPDPETTVMLHSLVRANQSGFVTTGSQPGEGPDDDGEGMVWWQREFVDGFVDEPARLRLQSVVDNSEGLTMVVSRVEESHRRRRACVHHDPDALAVPVSGMVPVPTADRFPEARPLGTMITTSVASQLNLSDLDLMTSGISSAMWETFLDSWYVTIYDGEWGRGRRVTDALDRFADLVDAEKHRYVTRDTLPRSVS